MRTWLALGIATAATIAWLARPRPVESAPPPPTPRTTVPPKQLTVLAFKRERQLEVWGDGVRLATWPILGASGGPGPKRREGDRQVPEGIYRLTTLNPQSAHHLSIRVDYPDAEDRAHGCTGGDIYVHGGSASIGCIAIGNGPIEHLFALAKAASKREIIIAPSRAMDTPGAEPWIERRYGRIRDALARFR